MLGAFLAVLISTIPCRGVGCDIPAKIGRSPVHLKVDTGADITILTAEGAQRAGLRLSKNAPRVVIRGAGGLSYALLTRATVEVDGHKEKSILIGVMPELDLGRVHGLLGMSFLERFETSFGRALELRPIDEGENEKKGGRGRSWWSVRFRELIGRRRSLERSLDRAKKIDERVEREFGKSASGEGLEDYVRKLADFFKKEERALKNEAARYAVPHAWRR